MSAQDCIRAAEKAAGGRLNLEQITEAIETLQERQKQLMVTDTSLSLEEASLRAADELGAEAMQAAAYKKRAAAINARRRIEALSYMRDNWADRPDLGAESFLVGTNIAGRTSRDSVSVNQAVLADSYIGGFLSDMEKDGVLAMLTTGAYDAHIAKALEQLSKPDPDMTGINTSAVKIAKIVRKWQDQARLDANKAGASIGKLDNYITRQSHDPLRMMQRGKDQWIRDILPRLTPETFKGQDPYEFLAAAYDGLASGVHMKNSNAAPASFTGPRNIAKSLSAERVLHFKSSDDWVSYNQDYGLGNLRESIIGTLSQMAEQTALMRKLGTNPEANWKWVLDEVAKDLKGDATKMKAFEDARKGKLDNDFKQVDGTARIPVNGDFARFGSTARAAVNMMSLGGSVLASLSDIGAAAFEMRYQGRNVFTGMGEMIKGLGRGRGTAEQREILSMVGVYLDGMRGAVTDRFSVDESTPGRVTRLQNLYFRANLQSWWTDTHRASVGLANSNYLALNAGKSFDQIPKDLSRAMGLYGIDAKRWDLMRSVQLNELDGRTYLTTENFATIPDDKIAAVLEAEGRKATKPAIDEMRSEVNQQLRNYIADRVSYAVLEPDARTRAMLRRDTQPGTVAGEAARFFGQFKSFGVSFVQKAIGRELYGRGYTPTEFGLSFTPAREVLQSMTTGDAKAQWLGFGQLFVMSSVFGYMAMAAKDIVKGREPRDPTDPKTITAAMIQGGGFGIYTDFLFGEASRFGNKPLETLAGPAASRAAQLLDIFQRARVSATGEDADLSSNLYRFVTSSIPGANLFYVKPILDYAIFYRMQEWMNPGSLRRMERRIERENNQQFLIRPSEVVR